MDFLKRFALLFSVSVVWVYACDCRCLYKPDVSDLPGDEATGGCESADKDWEPNMGPLQEWYRFLTTGLTLQSLVVDVLITEGGQNL